jgi:hypothetical protein
MGFAKGGDMDKQTTRPDVIAVFLFVLLAAALFLPTLHRAPARASRINCVSNLKQVGLAFRMWSNDHNDKFPWLVNPPDGTATIAPSPVDPPIGSVVDIYRSISNELVSPKVLACPNDTGKSKATAFSLGAGATGTIFDGKYLSYFAGIDADESKPNTILSGDRNIVGGGAGVLRLWNSANSINARWTSTIHTNLGNIGLGDGSAQQVTTPQLQNCISNALVAGAGQVRIILPP